MIGQICEHLHNFFEDGALKGTFTISDGGISLPSVLDGQYFRVTGSDLNDGVYQYPAEDLRDETFEGAIYPMKVPRALIDLAGEIEAWQTKYGEGAASPYQSESFGGYSYAKGASATGGASGGWQDAFRARLNPWRKL